LRKNSAIPVFFCYKVLTHGHTAKLRQAQRTPSQKFTRGLHRLETDFTDLKLQGSRESAKGQHLAITYRLAANNADEIISVLKRVSEVEDLMVML
jgi:hypothetical protein